MAEKDALKHVAGYCLINDVSERDFQLKKGASQWSKGKGCDTFGPLGPWLVTRDEVKDPQNLGSKLWVNDVLKQDSNTGQMIFNLAEQIAHLSSRLTLHPGDLILTGTPAGVGAGRGEFLKAGDTAKLWIEKIGELSNKMA